jgi:hypothetical protein
LRVVYDHRGKLFLNPIKTLGLVGRLRLKCSTWFASAKVCGEVIGNILILIDNQIKMLISKMKNNNL